MNVEPRADMVIVKKVIDQKEIGGIAIPEEYVRESTKGEVVAVGSGVIRKNGRKKPTYLDVGDIVLYPIYKGVDLEWEGEEYRAVHESDIDGLLEKKKIILRKNSVLLRKCQNPDIEEDGKVLLYLPDDIKEETNWCEVLDVGPECAYLTNFDRGRSVLVPEVSDEMTRCLVFDEDRHLWFMRETGWTYQLVV